MDIGLRALNRFGLGARVGQRDEIGDPRDWLRAQLRPETALLAGNGLPDAEGAADAVRSLLDAQRDRDPDAARAAARGLFGILARESQAALDRRLRTDAPFVERLVAFWSNHLCVSVAAKQPLAALAGLYEREAIRPHVLGRFEEMVLASARHPAMLLYLDNGRSIGPSSRAARFVERTRGIERGLNENYARELLELHTLGVDGGYAQGDVEALARVLTGWTAGGIGPLARPDEGVGFVFRPEMHEPGAKTVLGKRYGEDGAREGERVIADLCAHPATARFVAGKLVRHFVADEPPERAVDAIARVFRDSGGDLMRVSEALIDLEEAWAPESRKFRAPQDWIVAVGRTLGVPTFPPRLLQVLRQLRQPLWAPQAPKGYDDLLVAWADPDSLMNRAELAQTVAEAVALRFAPPTLAGVVDASDDGALPRLLADESIPERERLALAIAGPDFQWR